MRKLICNEKYPPKIFTSGAGKLLHQLHQLTYNRKADLINSARSFSPPDLHRSPPPQSVNFTSPHPRRVSDSGAKVLAEAIPGVTNEPPATSALQPEDIRRRWPVRNKNELRTISYEHGNGKSPFSIKRYIFKRSMLGSFTQGVYTHIFTFSAWDLRALSLHDLRPLPFPAFSIGCCCAERGQLSANGSEASSHAWWEDTKSHQAEATPGEKTQHPGGLTAGT